MPGLPLFGRDLYWERLMGVFSAFIASSRPSAFQLNHRRFCEFKFGLLVVE